MEALRQKVQTLLELAGLREPTVTFDAEGRRFEVFVDEGEWFKRMLPEVVSNLDHLVKLMSRRERLEDCFVDVNSYRKEREKIIVELAKAAARKATMEKQAVRLPAMNAYERRLVHVELAVRPDVATESEGEGKTRSVIVRPM